MSRRVEPFWRTWFPAPSTSQFIREYLLEHGEAYPYEVFKALREVLRSIGLPARGIKWGSYQNMRNYFYWLEKLGLIEPVRTEPSSNPNLQNKIYYRLTRKGIETPPDSLEWTNPRRALYPKSWEEHH